MQGVVGILGRLEAVALAIATARATLGPNSPSQMNGAPTSTISSRQNEPRQVRLLQAQRFLYGKAKRLISLQLWLVVSVAIAAAFLAFFLPDSPLKAVIAIVAIVVSLVDVTVLDPHQKRTIADAAKVQEAFDCEVLALPWDFVVAGDPVAREIVTEASVSYADKHGDAGLHDWYPTESDLVPLHFGRLVCQRSALAYDSALRRRYSAIVLVLPVLLLVTLLLAGVLSELTLEAFVVSVVPFMPVAIWALREHRRQTDSADANDALRTKIDALWERMTNGACDAASGSVEARTIQSELFRGRKNKTPILGWVYHAMRGGLERRMRAVAKELASTTEPAKNPANAVSATH